MELPPGTVSPIFMCELALEMRMPVGELAERMSAHELSVLWPAYFKYRARRDEREAEKAKARGGRR
jgi:hypothetical protein